MGNFRHKNHHLVALKCPLQKKLFKFKNFEFNYFETLGSYCKPTNFILQTAVMDISIVINILYVSNSF